MPLHWVLAAAAAAYSASSPRLGVAGFLLNSGSTGGLVKPAWFHCDRVVGVPAPNASPLNTAWSSRSATPQLRLSELSAQGEGGDSYETEGSALAMASFLRCHKSLLNDRGPEIPDGNLCMLLRGCDAHQRMISPLELKTNAQALPGAAAAGVMVSKGPAAAEALCEQLKHKVTVNRQEGGGLCPVGLLKLEVGKVHRLLQYATAAGLKKNFLSQTALQVMLELYEEAGLDSDRIFEVLQGLKDFYKSEMDENSFVNFFLPAYEEVVAKFKETKRLIRNAETVPVSSLPFEPTPDARTLTPLVVDIMSFKDKLPNLKKWEGKV